MMKLYKRKKVLGVSGGRARIRDEYGRVRTVRLRKPPRGLKRASGHRVIGVLPSGELVYVRSDTGKIAVTSKALDYKRHARKGHSPPLRRFEGD